MQLSELHPGTAVSNPRPGMPWGVMLNDQYLTDGTDLVDIRENASKYYNHFLATAVPIPDPTPYHATLREKGMNPQHLVLAASLTSGADPEIFAVDEAGDVIPAFEFLPPKEQGIQVKEESLATADRATVFYDGFQSEFTVLPHNCHGFLTDRVRMGLKTVLQQARKYNPTARLTIDSVVSVSRKTRMSVNPQHLKLGCAPSRNVYDEPPLAVPAPEELEFRFAGAHMHFGTTQDMPEHVVSRTVQLLDAIAGIAGVALGEGFNCPERRQYYGRAGEYRFHRTHDSKYPDQPEWSNKFIHRLEYRVPDTILLSHPATFNLMWDLTRVVWRMGMQGYEFLWDAPTAEVRHAINTYDVGLARRILQNNLRIFRVILTRANPSFGATPEEWVGAAEQAFFGGLGSVVEHPRDVAGNWWLDRETARYISNDPILRGYVLQDLWVRESGARHPDFWPTGRIWSSAAKIIHAGGRV
jgi:hypothetical protein